MTDITITEAISEFRKFSRAFKAMEYAETVLEALSKLDTLEKEANAQLASFESQRVSLGAEVKTLTTTVENLRSTKYNLEVEIKSDLAYKASKAADIINSANLTAGTIISTAEAVKDKLKIQVKELEQTKHELLSSLENAKAELKEVKDNITKTKQQIIQSLS